MKRKIITRLLCISVIFSFILSEYPVTAKTSDLVMPSGILLLGQSSYKLAEGVVETNLVTNNAAGTEQVRSFVAAVTLSSDVKILANYGTYYNKNSSKWGISSWKMSKTTSQAEKYETATGEKVVVAINGDFYNMSSGKPKGALVINGTTYHAASNRPYFAILKNGNAVIREAGTDITDNVMQAVGGSALLVKNGAVASNVSPAETKRTPCTSIGIKSDGTVIMYEVDGRDDDISEGYTLYDHARMLVSLGCNIALCLDGGGSSTFAARHGASSALTLQNVPSDGKERSVSSTLMVVAEPLATVQETVYTVAVPAKATATPKPKATATPKPKTTAKPTATPKSSKTTTKTTADSSKSTSIKTSGTGSSVAYDGASGDGSTAEGSNSSRIIKKKNMYFRIVSKKKRTAAFAGTEKKKVKKIVIPARVRSKGVTYTVTSVDPEACANNYKLKFLYLGKNIKKIGKRAFYNCTELKKVHRLSNLGRRMTFDKFYFRYVLDINTK